MKKGFLYLTTIIDLYSNYVVGWGISNTLDALFSLGAMQDAITRHSKPEIVNSDQSKQFTYLLWTDYMEPNDTIVSMDGKGRANDNVFIERLCRSDKYDNVYIKVPSDGLELYQDLKKYYNYYSHQLCHQGIDHKIPANLYPNHAA